MDKANVIKRLSIVLTNHVTCLDGLEGSSLVVMESDLHDLISRARSSLAVLVAVFPSKDSDGFIEEKLNGDFPSWVTSKDKKLLESSIGDIKANVVVAKDGSGKFKTVAEAVASTPDDGNGMDVTTITGSLNFIDGATISSSAIVGMNFE
ncbi:pectinesterase/pectinesterase inhibitor-like [Cicer arietinum]|uniref:pectinesterase/pectinesterase inhibitor-like n=1 Tax=Cicer arietinum TaxID=3827 RepID=UPI003CC5A7C4